jgi:hypothetical protein
LSEAMDGLPETRDAQLKQDLKEHIEVFTLADRLGISHLLTETASDILDIVCYLGLGIFRDLLLFSYAAVPLVRARRSLSSSYTGKTLPVSRVKKPVTTLKNHKIRVQNTTKEKGKEWLG